MVWEGFGRVEMPCTLNKQARLPNENSSLRDVLSTISSTNHPHSPFFDSLTQPSMTVPRAMLRTLLIAAELCPFPALHCPALGQSASKIRDKADMLLHFLHHSNM
jgi:hypothetical protein